MRYAEVAVNCPLRRPRTFTYTIPPGARLKPGCAVWIPFGPRVIQGVVFGLTDQSEIEETRSIAEVIDPEPLLAPYQLELASWISENYLSPLFDAVALMLPPGFEQRVLTFFQPAPEISEDVLSGLPPEQRRVLRLLLKHGRMELRRIKRKVGRAESYLVQLSRRGLVLRSQELERPRVGPRLVPYLSPALSAEQISPEVERLRKRRAFKQAELLQLLLAEGRLEASEARRKLEVSASAVKALERKGLIRVERLRVHRDPLAHLALIPTAPLELTSDQERAWLPLKEAIHRGEGDVFLLHGVTGSGKTELYLRALAETISRGRRAIVLVPEIALTPQTISRFASRFPQRVAVLHSRLSPGEQFDEWHRIRSGEFDVVIGPRSAIFAPQPNLGLIVIDEEHEWTYKQQESSPRYHAREVALKLAELTGSLVILGSATPDVESYYRARRGRYKLLELPRRVAVPQLGLQPRLPKVEIVDMRRELKEGNRSIFSRSLLRELRETLEAGEQAILFLNRRGTATFVQCRDCGYVLRCPRCEVTLTYHAVEGELLCHQCNYRTSPPSVCPRCWSRRIKFLGLGTQRLEEEVRRTFPGAQVLRWDRDVTRGKHSHEQILSRFQNHEADILIGTQMIAKGLDIPLVTLVGVVSADVGLHLPYFRAAERTFQLLSQVAGRAGRGKWGGRVIIQTYTPEHYAVQAAARQSFEAFYKQESEFRRRYHNPPFTRLVRLTFSHTNQVRCRQEAERMARFLREERDSHGPSDLDVLGPAPAYIPRIRGHWRWHIILRGSDPRAFLSELSLPPEWVVDVDPVEV